MTVKRLPLDADDLVQLYRSGMSPPQIGRQVGVSASTVRQHLAAAGQQLRSRSESQRLRIASESPASRKARAAHASRGRAAAKKTAAIDVPLLIAEFDAGASVKALARSRGVSEDSILYRLNANGRRGRTPSEQMSVRWARAGDAERAAMLGPAHAACRGRPRSAAANEKAAATRYARQTHIGPREQELAAELSARGIDFVQQPPVGAYNLDFWVKPGLVAVELECGNWGRPRPFSKYRERLEYILDRGWCVLIVFTQSVRLEPDRVADQIVALSQLAGRDESAAGKYGMIRGDGKRTSTVGCQLHDVARVPGF